MPLPLPFDFPTVLLLGVVLVLTALFFRQHLRTRERAEELFDRWRSREMDRMREELSRSMELASQASLERWKIEHEERIREDSVRRSQAVVAGKATEHLLPFFPDFPFSPKDVRFLGSPVDLVVFDGLDEGRLREVVFVEVKTGPSAALSLRERKIRDAVAAGRVRFQEIRGPKPAGGPRPTPESLYLPLVTPEGETTGQIELRVDAGELRFWNGWSEPPEIHALRTDVVVPLDGRRYALELVSGGGDGGDRGERCAVRLGPDAELEVDPAGRSLTFGTLRYVLETDRLVRRNGVLLLVLDGGR